ncbi:hypothetical protein Poli38472_004721 [Pythium oligandrum]|uniref:Macro domain-containing protein n=1 Tax=Pythium oligandrum TaxID=41045 RepID=A0A8K1CC59_PYTOL|nr:hypothetical protein Poli38472_004721 [Pythium oligandrum]|eukprot:TMW59652.1 hypothetical protein Poli38472_004721 [Pythium oligandrum]
MTSRRDVLDIAEATRLLLLALDFDAIDSLLLVLHQDPSGNALLTDAQLWTELIVLHFGARLPEDLAFLAVPLKERAWHWQDPERTCVELREFLRSGDEREHFRRTVHVLSRNIGLIEHINETPLDGLAFSTNVYLSNHFIGAAGAIFNRAGRELNEYVSRPEFHFRRNVGEAVATPAFDAGVRRLIHCVGPRISHNNCYQLLANTYENVMNVIIAEELKCVAIASFSTGSMGVPAKGAAKYGLRALQKVIRSQHWEGLLAIVCVEDKILKAFQEQLDEVLRTFNVVPPFTQVSMDGM